jgi:hypothetical protein
MRKWTLKFKQMMKLKTVKVKTNGKYNENRVLSVKSDVVVDRNCLDFDQQILTDRVRMLTI